MISSCEGRTQQDIGREIDEWRRRVGLKQNELALMIGLTGEKQYYRICIQCSSEFPQKSRRLMAKLMNVSIDYLTPDAEFEEDVEYINHIIRKGASVSQEGIETEVKKEPIPFSSGEKRIISYIKEFFDMKNEELNEDLADQINVLLRVAKRGCVYN